MYSIRTRVVSEELKDYIRKYFIYESGTVRRTDNRKRFTGHVDCYGYLVIKVKGKPFKAHQLVWFLCKGEFSDVELDHINRDKLDNRIENLRQANREMQTHNVKRQPNLKTGYPGIYLDESTKGLKKKYTFRYMNKTYRFYKLNEAIKAKEDLWKH